MVYLVRFVDDDVISQLKQASNQESYILVHLSLLRVQSAHIYWYSAHHHSTPVAL
jgi:hypothetical protein